MKKVFKVCDLDCANCAMKMERKINEIDGVNFASVSFMMQKITLDFDESKKDEILKKMVETCKKIEPDCKIIV
ncbi:MAG: heavy-metal-associated domain-containing protein [Clostridia bacterium]|nr:heavy-metal-associated domain-containing protein [Clostridia bacterium]